MRDFPTETDRLMRAMDDAAEAMDRDYARRALRLIGELRTCLEMGRGLSDGLPPIGVVESIVLRRLERIGAPDREG